MTSLAGRRLLFLEETRLTCGKVEQETAPLAENEIEVSTEYCGSHLIPVIRIKIIVGMRFCKSLKRLVGAIHIEN